MNDQFDLRVVDKPTVKMVGFTHYNDFAVDEWCKERGIDYETDATRDGDSMPELAGRLCYLSLNEKLRRQSGEGQNAAYLEHIREVGHTSVLEHSVFNFIIDDFTKNATQELVRHRVGVAYSVQSSRYVDTFSKKYFGDSGHCIGIHIPECIQHETDIYEEWLAAWQVVAKLYTKSFKRLRERGWDVKEARSFARHILPGAICNALMFTVNARELSHIFKLRGAFSADPEIRALAVALYHCVEGHNLFANWSKCVDSKYGEYLKEKPPTAQQMFQKLLDTHGPKIVEGGESGITVEKMAMVKAWLEQYEPQVQIVPDEEPEADAKAFDQIAAWRDSGATEASPNFRRVSGDKDAQPVFTESAGTQRDVAAPDTPPNWNRVPKGQEATVQKALDKAALEEYRRIKNDKFAERYSGAGDLDRTYGDTEKGP